MILKEIGDEDLLKECIIAFVIVKLKHLQFSQRNARAPYFISAILLVIGHEGMVEFEDLEEDDEVIGVVPTPQNSFRVSGNVDNSFVELGYEFHGAYHPDWKAELREEREKIEKKKGDKDG